MTKNNLNQLIQKSFYCFFLLFSFIFLLKQEANGEDYSNSYFYQISIRGEYQDETLYFITPGIALGKRFELNSYFLWHFRSELTVLKRIGNYYYPSINLIINGEWNFLHRFNLELGTGLQCWVENGGIGPVVDIGLSYRFLKSRLWIIDELFLSYSRFYLKNNLTHEAQIGLRSNF